jgi:hypothetical protein
MLAARHSGDQRRATRGNEDVTGGDALVAVSRAHLHGVRIAQRGPALQQAHTGTAQQLLVHTVQAGDLFGAGSLEPAPVKMRLAHRPAKACGFFKRFCIVRGIAVELLGDAAHVHAGATQRGGLGHHHARTALRGHACGAHAAAAAANDEQVAVKVFHAFLSGHPATGGLESRQPVTAGRRVFVRCAGVAAGAALTRRAQATRSAAPVRPATGSI